MMAHETDIPNKTYSPKEIEQKWLDLIIKSSKSYLLNLITRILLLSKYSFKKA